MGLSSIRRLKFLENLALVPEIAEVPKELVEEFSRDYFWLPKNAHVFASQLSYTIEEINSGRADFLGWLVRRNPADAPEGDDSIAEPPQRAVVGLLEDSHESASSPLDGAAEAEVPKEIFDAFVRECCRVPDHEPIDDKQRESVLRQIADGELDFLCWAKSAGFLDKIESTRP